MMLGFHYRNLIKIWYKLFYCAEIMSLELVIIQYDLYPLSSIGLLFPLVKQ